MRVKCRAWYWLDKFTYHEVSLNSLAITGSCLCYLLGETWYSVDEIAKDKFDVPLFPASAHRSTKFCRIEVIQG